MKKMMRAAAALLILVLLGGALGGCTAGEEKKLHAKAEEYVKTLQKKQGVSDSFTVSSERVIFSDKAASVPFSVKSQAYGTDFTVWVSRDGSTVSDDYYRLYLQQEADEKLKALVDETIGEGLMGVSVDFVRVEHPALSGHAAGSLGELLRLAADKAGVEGILIVRLVNAEQINPDEQDVDRLLLALQEKGYYGKFYPYVSDAVWFEVLKDGFWVTKQTGADGGAYLQREEYTPTASR